FFFSSRRRHTRFSRDWSSDVCSSDLDEVAVYDPNIGQFPPDGYKAIGPIRVERPMGTSHADLILALRIEAAKLGADGIIIERIGRSTEGTLDTDLSRDQTLVATARAIYYPPPPATP